VSCWVPTLSLKSAPENRDVPVVWDSRTAFNPHMLVMGRVRGWQDMELRRMIQAMAKKLPDGPVRIHVLDVHGDIDLAGASTVKFPSHSLWS